MPNDATSPQGTAGETAPLSFEESVETLTNLDLDDTPDLQEEDEGQEGVEGDGPDDATVQDEDPVGEAGQDGSQEVAAGGKFVSKDAKVRLDDGSVITVGELARNNLFQRDYTTKTTELAAERETFQKQRTVVETFAQQTVQEREFLLEAAQHFVPQPPDPELARSGSPKFDPAAYIEAEANYKEKMQVYSQLQHQHQIAMQRQAEEQHAKNQQYRQSEATRLFEALPELKKPEAYRKFWSAATETMAKYGFTEQELNETYDHRFYRAMNDLVRLDRAVARSSQVQKEVQGKPKLIGGGKRMDPKGKEVRNRQSLAEQQRRTGSLEDTVKRLESLI